jgi:alkylation response protein AidB-like acyl-CoA dehydrogenase
VDNGTLRAADASAAKVYGSELMMRANRVLQGVVGPDVALDADSPGAVLGGGLAKGARSGDVMTFIGGANEIQRDLIAQLGLGLPRVKR